MRLEINIADNSPEAQLLASVVGRDQVSPEEALRSILLSTRPVVPKERNFREESHGILKAPAEAKTTDDGVANGQAEVPPARKEGKSKIPGLPSEPISAEDAAIVDEALALVMAARRERSEQLFGE